MPTHFEAELFDDNLLMFAQALRDIENAQKYIYLELYRFNNDAVGVKFRNALARKAKEGVEVKILVDSWGTSASPTFFADTIKNGAELRYFKKLKFFIDFFTKNHRRNHRKILVIDNDIVYVGSSNYTSYSLAWRELVLRLQHRTAAIQFKKIFLSSFAIFNQYNFKRLAFKKKIKFGGFEIIQDIPSIYRQQIKKRYEKMIQKAKESIWIETPYFLPGFKLRKEMMDAVQRGVNVNVIMPKHSDVRLVDLLRSRYLGLLCKNGIKIHYYVTNNLHAKGMLIDDKHFSIGSANFDYRSFRYQYELTLIGDDPTIIGLMKKHISNTLMSCEPFDYHKWNERPRMEKVFEWLLLPFRHFL